MHRLHITGFLLHIFSISHTYISHTLCIAQHINQFHSIGFLVWWFPHLFNMSSLSSFSGANKLTLLYLPLTMVQLSSAQAAFDEFRGPELAPGSEVGFFVHDEFLFHDIVCFSSSSPLPRLKATQIWTHLCEPRVTLPTILPALARWAMMTWLWSIMQERYVMKITPLCPGQL